MSYLNARLASHRIYSSKVMVRLMSEFDASLWSFEGRGLARWGACYKDISHIS